MKLRLLLCGGILCCSGIAVWAEDGQVVLREGFEGEDGSGLAARLIGHRHIALAKGAGRNGSDGIRVAYVGSERGSERVVVRFPLGVRMKEATLSFDVKFEEGFQWVRGGKLHGLGPKVSITGGKERRPEGWSARIMFKAGGKCSPYLYDQDETKTWGVGRNTKEAVLRVGRWHRVEYRVRLNEVGKANGSVRILIDGREVAGEDQVEFRGVDGKETLIQQLLFSTFHGGQSPRNAPVGEDGKPTTVFAVYDNFEVVEGVPKGRGVGLGGGGS